MKRTIIINWGTLNGFGGIEKYIYYTMKVYSESGVRIVWLKNKKSIIGDAFKKLIDNSKNIEIANVSSNHLYWFKHDDICFEKNEFILVESYTVFDMLRALTLQRQYKHLNIKCLYGIPDTTGNYYFIERFFKGWLRCFVFNKIRNTISDWNNSNMLVFFDGLQIPALENNYGIIVNNPKEKLLRSLLKAEPINQELLKERSLRKGKFNIVTVGRFDYPHKGYMLGMVKAYQRLKEKYPQITLTFIGHGKDENLLRQAINNLPESFHKDVNIVGAVPYNELLPYYADKHLSIAVAGGALDATNAGVMSLVARNHYSEECEVYGYMPEKINMSVSSEQGVIVDSYIEEVIHMSNEEYYNKCMFAYNSINDGNIDKWYIFERADKCMPYKMSLKELSQYILINYLRKIILLFSKL